MRKIIILFLLFTIFSSLQAQNTISVTFQPVDLGAGIKYDHYFKTAGIYIAGAYGNYSVDEQYIKDHIRISGGVSTSIPGARLSFGVVYHRFGEVNGTFPPGTMDPISVEFGAYGYRDWFNIGIRYDFIKHESCIDMGVNF